MSKFFPFIPFGEAMICRKISTNMTAGGVYVPESAKSESGPAIVIAEILAVAAERVSEMGVKIPKEAEVGDIIAVAAKDCRAIAFGLRDKFLEHGYTTDECKDMFVAFLPTALGKFCKKQYNRAACIAQMKEFGVSDVDKLSDEEIRAALIKLENGKGSMIAPTKDWTGKQMWVPEEKDKEPARQNAGRDPLTDPA